MKLVNSYDENGYFNGVLECQESPLEPGIYLIPAKSTELPLPNLSDTEEAKFVDGSWAIVKSRKEEEREKTVKEKEEKEKAAEDLANYKLERKSAKNKAQAFLGLSNKEMDLLFGED